MKKYMIVFLLSFMNFLYASYSYISLIEYEKKLSNDVNISKKWNPITISDIRFLDEKAAVRILDISSKNRNNSQIVSFEKKISEEDNYFAELMKRLGHSEVLIEKYILNLMGMDKQYTNIVKIVYHKNRAIMLLENKSKKENIMYYINHKNKRLIFSAVWKYGERWKSPKNAWIPIVK